MASKVFEINETPHDVKIGGVTYLMQPEIGGAAFATRYAALCEVQKQAEGNEEDPDTLIAVDTAMREFVASFMLPEGREAFLSVELPTRVLIGLIQWTAELYGGGPGNEGGGSSSGSS